MRRAMSCFVLLVTAFSTHAVTQKFKSRPAALNCPWWKFINCAGWLVYANTVTYMYMYMYIQCVIIIMIYSTLV